MTRPLLAELPYSRDSARLFESVAEKPWAVFLDSVYPAAKQGRYDIISADPMLILSTRGGLTEIRSASGVRYFSKDPFDLLRQALLPWIQSPPGLPFCGGAIGYFGYDLGRRLERLPVCAQDDEHLPEMAIGIYDWALVVDHKLRRSWLVGQGRDSRTRCHWHNWFQRFRTSVRTSAESGFRVAGSIKTNMDRNRYEESFERIKHYIREGDCYQVNLAQRFTVDIDGSPWAVYKSLRRINPAPFAAYLNTPHAQVLSASPELFLKVIDGQVETKPIKGTRARVRNMVRDARIAEQLQGSLKDRAENLMIVDLLRNDIGKSCALGSVRVPRLFELQSFTNVHHLVSTVTGRLRTGRDALDLIAACFPGGSITGAPKRRAMQIIDELEPVRREVYCGSVIRLGFDGNLDSSITIRTVLLRGEVAYYWAGGGIVADSECAAEYQESLDKAAAFLRLMGGSAGSLG